MTIIPKIPNAGIRKSIVDSIKKSPVFRINTRRKASERKKSEPAVTMTGVPPPSRFDFSKARNGFVKSPAH
jgi:hypothetical protein